MLLGGMDPLITGITALKAGNKIIPKNDIAQTIIDATPEAPGKSVKRWQQSLLRSKPKN